MCFVVGVAHRALIWLLSIRADIYNTEMFVKVYSCELFQTHMYIRM